MMVLGLAVSYLFYIRRPYLPEELANQQPLLYEFLLNKWYFDELYDLIFVRPAKWIGRFLWKFGDGYIIDGFGPDGVSAWVLDITRNVVKIQTGYLYHYAFAMLIGVAGLITWFMFGFGRPVNDNLAHSLGRNLPAVGRRAVGVFVGVGQRRGCQSQRALDRAVDHADHLRGVADPGGALRRLAARLPVRRKDVVARQRHYLPHGR